MNITMPTMKRRRWWVSTSIHFMKFFFFLSGDVDYIIEGKTYALRPGDILLTSCSDIHRPDIRPGKPYERIVIWLEENFLTI